MLKLGSHVGMSGKKMMLGSVEEALSYGANTFMIYTGAPQNTRRKEISELNIDAAHALMKENDIDEFIIHAPYIINLANTVKPETYEFSPTGADPCRRHGQQHYGTSPGCSCGCRCGGWYCLDCKGIK